MRVADTFAEHSNQRGVVDRERLSRRCLDSYDQIRRLSVQGG
jgi:hypothetical protein